MADVTTSRRGQSAPIGRSPQNLLAAISWALLVTVMIGGYALLRFLTSGDGLTDHEERFFRAGHAHAGVLAAIGILYSGYLARTRLGYRAQVRAWVVYLMGVLLQSGGMFLHAFTGAPGESSAGTWMTVAGALVLAGSVLFLSWALFRNRDLDTSQPEGA